jgi:hypothetical protein
MDFIATEPLCDHHAPTEDIVSSDGWFPDIDLVQMRAVMRLDGTVTPIRLKTAVQGAVIQVNQELHTWQHTQQEADFTSLASIPSSTIDGQSILVWYYVRAVSHLSIAELQSQYRDFASTHKGCEHAEGLESRIEEERRLARCALRALLHKTAITVECL